MDTVGKRIKHHREAAGFSQVEFASKIGVSKQTLYKYENDIITNIPSDKIETAAAVLGVSPGELMGWSDSEPAPYYLDDEARELAEFLFRNPEYKILFDASRKVKKEDIQFVKDLMDRMTNNG